MSTQPRKERRALHNAPTHERRARIASHLDGPLLEKYKARSITLRKGDTVRIMRGEWSGHSGKVLEIDTTKGKVTVDGVTVAKAKATQVARAIDPSNLVITKLDLTDPLRRKKLGASEADARETEESAPAPKKTKKTEGGEQ